MQKTEGKRRAVNPRFATTQWSLVLAASDEDTAVRREALSSLCESYWYPVYAHVRSRTRGHEDAEDLTQGFFVHLLEKETFAVADPGRGRFRSFLKASLHNFMANERERQRARKRQGGRPLVSLDSRDAESRYRLELASGPSPEAIFEQRWSRVLLSRALDALRSEAQASKTADRFSRLEPFLTGRPEGSSYAGLAHELGISEAAVRVAVHRMRRRFAEILHMEVSRTVENPDDVREEIRFLLSVVES